MDPRTVVGASDGTDSRHKQDSTPQEISPDNSEEPPGLSAGSSDSEELPDPTRGTYPGSGPVVKSGISGKSPQRAGRPAPR